MSGNRFVHDQGYSILIFRNDDGAGHEWEGGVVPHSLPHAFRIPLIPISIPRNMEKSPSIPTPQKSLSPHGDLRRPKNFFKKKKLSKQLN